MLLRCVLTLIFALNEHSSLVSDGYARARRRSRSLAVLSCPRSAPGRRDPRRPRAVGRLQQRPAPSAAVARRVRLAPPTADPQHFEAMSWIGLISCFYKFNGGYH